MKRNRNREFKSGLKFSLGIVFFFFSIAGPSGYPWLGKFTRNPPPCSSRLKFFCKASHRTSHELPQRLHERACANQAQSRLFRRRKKSEPKIRVVETVVLENGVFVLCRKQVVSTKIGENSDSGILPPPPPNKAFCSSNPGNRRK